MDPDALDGYTSGELARFLDGTRVRTSRWLGVDERLLLAYLSHSLEAWAAHRSLA